MYYSFVIVNKINSIIYFNEFKTISLVVLILYSLFLMVLYLLEFEKKKHQVLSLQCTKQKENDDLIKWEASTRLILLVLSCHITIKLEIIDKIFFS